MNSYAKLESYELEARRDRAFQQRIYLINTMWPNQDEAKASFGILGSTRTVYIVEISDASGVKCTCPDFHNRGAYCKHALFLLLRVLKVPFAQLVSNLEHGITESIDQVTKEAMLHFLLSRTNGDVNNTDEDLVVDDASEYESEVIEAMDELRTRPSPPPPRVSRNVQKRPKTCGGAQEARKEVARRPIEEDDECAICFEALLVQEAPGQKQKKAEIIAYCRYGCGQNLHQDCLNKWADQKSSMVTCVYCRTPWI